MNNILIYSDLHINQSSIKECIHILEEIGMLANKYNCDTLINLGDTFDCLKPSSQEMDIFATFIRRLGNKKHIIISADSHESETKEISVLNHYGILSDNVLVTKEYKDDNHMYCGHFILKESNINYGAKLSKEDLKNYLYVFLGHQHSFQIIKPNCVQLGSCRYIDFSEAGDKQKVIAIISDYNTDKEQVHFLKLKTPYPMAEFILNSSKINKLGEKPSKTSPLEAPESINLVQNTSKGKDTDLSKSKQITSTNPLNLSQIDLLRQKLDKLDKRTKVKVKILDFKAFQEFLPLVNKYNAKFEVFKYSTEFNVVSDNIQKGLLNETKNFKNSFQEWLGHQKIDVKIKDILLKEIE